MAIQCGRKRVSRRRGQIAPDCSAAPGGGAQPAGRRRLAASGTQASPPRAIQKQSAGARTVRSSMKIIIKSIKQMEFAVAAAVAAAAAQIGGADSAAESRAPLGAADQMRAGCERRRRAEREPRLAPPPLLSPAGRSGSSALAAALPFAQREQLRWKNNDNEIAALQCPFALWPRHFCVCCAPPPQPPPAKETAPRPLHVHKRPLEVDAAAAAKIFAASPARGSRAADYNEITLQFGQMNLRRPKDLRPAARRLGGPCRVAQPPAGPTGRATQR